MMTHPKWAGVLLAALLFSLPAAARVAPRPGGSATTSITVEAGSGRVIQLAGLAANLFVADPKVAEARPASANSLFVFGLAVGHTTIAAMDNSGHSVGVYDLMVVPSSAAASLAGSAINRALPGDTVRTRAGVDGVEISGQVATPADAERAAAAAQSLLPDKQLVANRLQVSEPIQVLLRVRIVEMSRTLTRDLGLNWQNLAGRIGNTAEIGIATAFPLADLTSGSVPPAVGALAFRKTSVEAIVDALAQDQLVHILAEPNLTTMSGEPASFLVGGEFPVPIAQEQNTITVDFKQYGISLAFVPTVMSGDRINMHVRPEISQLTDQGAVQLTAGNNSIVIPALQVRRADTTVEMGSGQSFAIAGLLSDNVTHTSNGVPFLGEIPGIGALFRSDSFKRQESEIVIIVTPFIVHPVNQAAPLHEPSDGWTPPNDLERILLLRQNGTPAASPVAHISGDAGFIVQ
ncbi:type II and III secretion system protein family protein [Rhodopila sp.]|uniref:type II and III secretion system protein family protein n=1 Tax=Rhodopila sp. TaxID=2480087 RepID=UPI003D112BCA